MRDFLGSSDDADLIKSTNLWTQATVDAKNLAVDHGCQWKEVEHLATSFPDGRISVLGLTFFVETVDLGDLTRLVVSADQRNPIGVSGESMLVPF